MNSNIHLSGVEQTLLLPLWGRVNETIKPEGIINDPKAVELAQKINLDLSEIGAEQNPITQLAWAARAYNVDYEIKSILEREMEVTIINLGCGFDTSYFRVKKSGMHWYDIDLPNVIHAKRKLLPEDKNYKMIGGSVLDRDIFNAVKIKGKVVVIAVGLLFYFTESQVKDLIKNIADHFKDVLLIAEVFSPKGVKLANEKVIKNIKGARAVWGIKSKKELAVLNKNIDSIELYPVFKMVKKKVDKKFRMLVYLTDYLKIMSFAIIHIKGDL